MKPLIICLSSDLPKDGKNTACTILKNIFDYENDMLREVGRSIGLYEFREFAFATELKKHVHEKYNVDESRLGDSAYKELIRPHYIFEGDGARLKDGFVWCKKLNEVHILPFLKYVVDSNIAVMAISDNRYCNEDDFFKEKELCGFDAYVQTIHIVVNDNVRRKRHGDSVYLQLAATERSRSQRELNFALGAEFDFIVDNNGTIEEFEQKIRAICEIILHRYYKSEGMR